VDPIATKGLIDKVFFAFRRAAIVSRCAIPMRILGVLATSVLLLACAPAPSESLKADGPRGRMLQEAAGNNGVPAELLVAIAHVEGGLFLAEQRDFHEDEAVPVAGMLELRHGRFNSLARGAELSGRSQKDLVEDLKLGTDAGARVLANLPTAPANEPHHAPKIEDWADAVEELSGHYSLAQRQQYRAEVFRILRHGATIRAKGGEIIELPANPAIPLGLTMIPPGLEALGTPEYAGALWLETPQFAATTCNGTQAKKYDTDRGPYSVTMVAIHDTEGGWNASVATLQNDPCKSVHYIVDKDGSRVGQFIPEAYTGWHAGNYWYNQHSVGIEHVGYAGVDDYQTAMYQKSADLARNIADRYGLPLDRSTFVGHQEVPDPNDIPNSSPPCPDSPSSCIKNLNYGGASHHVDPGIYWEWCQYMELVGGTCKCNDAFSLWNCVADLSMMVRCPEGTVEIVHCVDPCVVEPIGVNDHCTPVVMSGSGGAGGAAGMGGMGGMSGMGGTGGSGGMGGSVVAGGGGTGGFAGAGAMGGYGGMGGAADGGEGGTKPGTPSGQTASCSCSAVEQSNSGGFAALVGLGLISTWRRKRTLRR
jgi:MYXO-CTERM domain-containing protein